MLTRFFHKITTDYKTNYKKLPFKIKKASIMPKIPLNMLQPQGSPSFLISKPPEICITPVAKNQKANKIGKVCTVKPRLVSKIKPINKSNKPTTKYQPEYSLKEKVM